LIASSLRAALDLLYVSAVTLAEIGFGVELVARRWSTRDLFSLDCEPTRRLARRT
jgi:hypothetical protein